MNLGWDDNDIIETNKYTGKESKLGRINTRYRDAEVKNRFTRIKGYKEEFVQMINDVLKIDGQLISVENLDKLEGVILQRFRTNDILLRANVQDGDRITGIFYYFVEAQSSRDYFIFDRITHYYHLLLEDIVGRDMHNIKSVDAIKDAYFTLGMPIFIVLNNSSLPTKYGVEGNGPITLFKYSDYRKLYDKNYTKFCPIDYTMFIINDNELDSIDDQYNIVKLYTKKKNKGELEDMKYKFDLSNDELNVIRESIYEKDLSSDYIEEGREEGREEGIEYSIIQLAKHNMPTYSISNILNIPEDKVVSVIDNARATGEI